MTTWQDLEAELDAWAGAGLEATFWWRDDDAVEPSAALERLLALAASSEIPLAIAAIPGRCSSTLPRRLAETAATVTALQHGYLHCNHAPAGAKKAELGSHRPTATICEELGRGAALMAGLFGSAALPVLVPPWNRIAREVLPALPGLGLTGLSRYGPRSHKARVDHLVQTNTHVDIIRWKQPRGFLGEPEALALLVGHLSARRRAMEAAAGLDPLEPTGLLTHHLAHNEAAWTFLARLLPLLAGHAASRALTAAESFGDLSAPGSGGQA
jgi:hypothetical protein